MGDSGTWVIDSVTHALYGHVVAGRRNEAIAYILHANAIRDGIRAMTHSPVDLPSTQEIPQTTQSSSHFKSVREGQGAGPDAPAFSSKKGQTVIGAPETHLQKPDDSVSLEEKLRWLLPEMPPGVFEQKDMVSQSSESSALVRDDPTGEGMLKNREFYHQSVETTVDSSSLPQRTVASDTEHQTLEDPRSGLAGVYDTPTSMVDEKDAAQKNQCQVPCHELNRLGASSLCRSNKLED